MTRNSGLTVDDRREMQVIRWKLNLLRYDLSHAIMISSRSFSGPRTFGATIEPKSDIGTLLNVTSHEPFHNSTGCKTSRFAPSSRS